MKWTNCGHEFDMYKDIFTQGKKILIYGAGTLGTELLKKVSFVDCVEAFIDNSTEKQSKNFCGLPVYASFDTKIDFDKYIVVVAVEKDRKLLMQQMRTLGFKDGISLFEYSSFVDFYLTLYMWFSWGKVYFYSVCINVTTKCNFNCHGCLALVPKNKFACHYDSKMFMSSLDSFFQHVDYVDIFQMSGGETFLYPDHKILVDYIGENYRHKINYLYTTTNGSIAASKELMDSLKKNRFTVIVDDYTDSVQEYADKFERNLSLLVSNGVSVMRNKVDKWIDILPDNCDNSHFTEDELVHYYGACSLPWIDLLRNRLYSCTFASYAIRASLVEETPNDYIDLTEDLDPMKLIEFRLGYTKKGYLDFCKLCQGYIAINKFSITPAVQIKKSKNKE